MNAAVMVRKSALAMLSSRTFAFIKDIKTVSVGVHYTTYSKPDTIKGKEFTLDVDKTKQVFTRMFNRKGELDMAAYKYKVIWLNEMGDEQFSYHEHEDDRNVKMQALVDDGYSPVFREVDGE